MAQAIAMYPEQHNYRQSQLTVKKEWAEHLEVCRSSGKVAAPEEIKLLAWYFETRRSRNGFFFVRNFDCSARRFINRMRRLR